jgi:hypothetical protein
VNANPSGIRTPLTGGRGRSIARRTFASTSELPATGFPTTPSTAGTGARGRRAIGSCGGTRRAMTARRGAPNSKRALQGRNGDRHRPRHVHHPVSHPLPLANRSAVADLVRRLVLERGRCLFRDKPVLSDAASSTKARPRDRDAPTRDRQARNTELAQPVRGVAVTPLDGPPEGKES